MEHMEDPWGDDDPPETGVVEGPRPMVIKAEGGHKNLKTLCQASLQPPESRARGAGTLQSMCLGCMGTFLEDFLEAGPDATILLSSDEKASLLAVGRRKSLLGDEMLHLLRDEEFRILEVSFSDVSSSMLWESLACMPCIRHLALIGVVVESKLLLELTCWCPQLQTLRIGGFPVNQAKSVRRALQALAPTTQQPKDDSESWEDSLDECSQEQPQLRHFCCLVWPDGPPEEIAKLEKAFPRLAVNPTPKSARSRALPGEADWRLPLDVAAASAVSQVDWDSILPEPPEPSEHGDDQETLPNGLRPGELTIAQRFKLAYQSRDERMALKAERNRKQAWRRYIRNNPSKQLIMMAESGVPMAGLRL